MDTRREHPHWEPVRQEMQKLAESYAREARQLKDSLAACGHAKMDLETRLAQTKQRFENVNQLNEKLVETQTEKTATIHRLQDVIAARDAHIEGLAQAKQRAVDEAAKVRSDHEKACERIKQLEKAQEWIGDASVSTSGALEGALRVDRLVEAVERLETRERALEKALNEEREETNRMTLDRVRLNEQLKLATSSQEQSRRAMRNVNGELKSRVKILEKKLTEAEAWKAEMEGKWSSRYVEDLETSNKHLSYEKRKLIDRQTELKEELGIAKRQVLQQNAYVQRLEEKIKGCPEVEAPYSDGVITLEQVKERDEKILGLQCDLDHAESMIHEMRRALTSSNADVKSLRAELERVTKAYQNGEKASQEYVDDLRQQFADETRLAERHEQRVLELEDDIAELKSALRERDREENKGLSRVVPSLELDPNFVRNAELERENADLMASLREASGYMALNHNMQEALRLERQRIENLTLEKAELEKAVAQRHEDVQALAAQFKIDKETIADLTREKAKLDGSVKEYQGAVGRAVDRSRKLEEELRECSRRLTTKELADDLGPRDQHPDDRLASIEGENESLKLACEHLSQLLDEARDGLKQAAERLAQHEQQKVQLSEHLASKARAEVEADREIAILKDKVNELAILVDGYEDAKQRIKQFEEALDEQTEAAVSYREMWMEADERLTSALRDKVEATGDPLLKAVYKREVKNSRAKTGAKFKAGAKKAPLDPLDNTHKPYGGVE
jgi:chromosome segregation ATPase